MFVQYRSLVMMFLLVQHMVTFEACTLLSPGHLFRPLGSPLDHVES